MTPNKRTKANKSARETYQELLRTSERSTLNRCRQRWHWGYVDLLRPIREAPALRFGTLIHKALEIWYNPNLPERTKALTNLQLNRRTNKRGPKLSEIFAALFDEELEQTTREWPKWRDEDDEWHNYRELGEAMLEGYVAEFHEQDKEYIVLAVEQRFQTKIRVPRGEDSLAPPSPTLYVGTFDKLLYHLPSRRLLFGDYKTTKNDPTKNSHLALDEQAGAYWAYGPSWIRSEAPPSLHKQMRDAVAHLPLTHRQAVDDLRFDGILYDFLKKSLPDDRPVNAEGHVLNKNGTVSKRQPGPLFYREPVFRDVGDRRNVLRRIYEDAKEIGMMRNDELAIKKSPDRFICIGCQFIDMCELHETGANWKAFRDGMYQMWNPYDTYYIDWDELD